MKGRDYSDPFEHLCLHDAILRCADQHDKLPDVEDPRRKTAYELGTKFAELVLQTRKGSLVLTTNQATEIQQEYAEKIVACFGGKVSFKAVTGLSCKKILKQGNVIAIMVNDDRNLHAEYLLPDRNTVAPEKVEAVVLEELLSLNVIVIQWS